jgi:hypothetical protein
MTGQPAPGSNDFLTFDVTGLTVTELDYPHLAPHNVFDRNANIRVAATVTFDGVLAHILSHISHCEFTVALESIGPGYEGVLGTVEQDPVGTNPFIVHLDYHLAHIAAQLTPGAYWLTATVIVHGRTPAGALIQFPVMGFADTAVMIAEHPA